MKVKATIDGLGHHTRADYDSEAPFAVAMITDEHSASSHGLPVVLINGQPYGPHDLTLAYGDYYVLPEAMQDADARLSVLRALQRAGYNVMA